MDVSSRGLSIEFRCKCGHRAVLDGEELWGVFFQRQWDFRLCAMRDHVRCTRCNARPSEWHIVGGSGKRVERR